ncbi:MAG: dockerin type I domain-containing protein [Pirellulaceae bacterium]|nr:dockerin type I domain-containing protein [Pirellulaceae bacterium]
MTISTTSRRRRTRRGAWPPGSQRRRFFEALEDRRLLTASPAEIPPGDAFPAAADPAGRLAELTGSIVDGGTIYPLSIAPRSESQGILIDPDRTTWLVIHGRLGAATQPIYQDLAAAADGYSPDDQVLLLDWEPAATGWWDGESRIEPVGRWAAAALDDYGFDAGSLNLLGYSWGAYVADELAEELVSRQTQPVNSVVLLDPASDVPFNGYNPNNSATVNFAAHSEFSWAFRSGGFEGSATSPKTAHEAFVLENSDHYVIRDQFIRLLDTNHAGQLQNPWFSLERLVNHGAPSAPWLANAIDAAGNLVPNASGGYEAVIALDADGLAEWLTYEPTAGPPDTLRTDPFWTAVPPEAVDDLFEIDMADWTGSLQRDALSGLLANDTGVGLAAVRQLGPDQGDVALSADGAFTYTPWEPATPFGFRDSFTYEITDEFGQTDAASVQIIGLPNLQNQSLPTDVSTSGLTTPLDVLLIVNALNRFGEQTIAELAQRDDVPVYYYDVNGDDELTAADALAVIDVLNLFPNAGGEGEAEEVFTVTG